MKNAVPAFNALAISVSLALLSGCGGAQPMVAAYGYSMPQTPKAEHSHDLIYAGDSVLLVDILEFPSGKYVKTFQLPDNDVEGYFCSDSRGDVFIPTSNQAQAPTSHLYEYSHGSSSPKAELTINSFVARGCAVDPRSGNVAVAGYTSNPLVSSLVIFSDGLGQPQYYSVPNVTAFTSCTYDNKGNLFVAGQAGVMQILELPQGSNALVGISLSPKDTGNVQWDGSYLAVSNMYRQGARTKYRIFRVQVSGTTGEVIGETPLAAQRKYLHQIWIQGSTALSPPQSNTWEPRLFFWRYPGGGSPSKVKPLTGLRLGFNITVSVAPH